MPLNEQMRYASLDVDASSEERVGRRRTLTLWTSLNGRNTGDREPDWRVTVPGGHSCTVPLVGFDFDGAVDGKRADLRGTRGRLLAHGGAQTNHPQPTHHCTTHLSDKARNMRRSISRRQTCIRPWDCPFSRWWEGQQNEGEGERQGEGAAACQGAGGWEERVEQWRSDRRGDPFRSTHITSLAEQHINFTHL